MGKNMYLKEEIEEYLDGKKDVIVNGILSIICQNNGHVPFVIAEGKTEIYCERCERKIGYVAAGTGVWKLWDREE